MNNCENQSSIFTRFGLITAITLMLFLLSSCASVYEKVENTDLPSLSIEERTKLLYSVFKEDGMAVSLCVYDGDSNCRNKNPGITADELRTQLVTRIIESGPINYSQAVGGVASGDSPGSTVLHVAVQEFAFEGESDSDIKIIESLLKNGASDAINQQTNSGDTALTFTSVCPITLCKSGHAERIYKLLLSYGADDSIPNEKGYTPKYFYLEREQEKNNPISTSSGGIDSDTLMQALVIGADAALAEKQRQINEANMIRQQQMQYQQQHQARLQQQSNATNYSNNNYQQNNLSPQQQYEAEMSMIRNSRVALSSSFSNSAASSGNQNTYSYFSVLISDKFNGQQALPAIGTKYGNGLVVGYRDRYQPKLCPSTSLEILRVPIVKVSVNTQAEINTRVEQTRKSKNGAAFSTLEEAQNNYIKSDSPYFSSDEAINAIKNRSCGGVTQQ